MKGELGRNGRQRTAKRCPSEKQLNSSLLAITFVPSMTVLLLAIGKIQQVARTIVANVKLLILSELVEPACAPMMQDYLCSNFYVCNLEAHHPTQGDVTLKSWTALNKILLRT